MINVPTYQGVIREGKIQLTQAANLPEGSQVVVLATGDWTQSTLLDPHIARRKANGWLVTYVGSVMAQWPQLHQVNGKLAWRFNAFLTGRSQPVRGPVSVIDVDAYSGEILTDVETASEMIANAKAIVRSLSSSE